MPQNRPTIAADRLRRLRALCLSIDGVEEKLAWGDPTWRTRAGRMFAGQKGNVDGHRPSLWFAAPPGVQGMLVGGDPERFFVPPYVGARGWVGTWMDLPALDWSMLRSVLEQAHDWVGGGGGGAAGKKRAKK